LFECLPSTAAVGDIIFRNQQIFGTRLVQQPSQAVSPIPDTSQTHIVAMVYDIGDTTNLRRFRLREDVQWIGESGLSELSDCFPNIDLRPMAGDETKRQSWEQLRHMWTIATVVPTAFRLT
jgi:hypothetical protein